VEEMKNSLAQFVVFIGWFTIVVGIITGLMIGSKADDGGLLYRLS
jgi:hypothetical protein